jgi:RHS repeat-associated protein
VPKNGYAYLFVSNESDLPVYFDNFMVTHQRGAITEETHYYPQGLKAAGICAKAYGKPVNKYNYQAEYSEEEAEAGWNDFDLRSYDPQLARWVQTDPYDEFASPYVGMGGDPVNNVDPDGGSVFEGVGLGVRTAVGALVGAIAGVTLANVTNNEDDASKWAAYGALIGGGITFSVSSPLHINVQFVPTWGQVRKDMKSHKFSAYLGAKLRSIVNEVFSLGKIVTITGDGFVANDNYTDENGNQKISKGTLTSKVQKYFANHRLAIDIANAFTEFHSGNMGYCSNSSPSQFSGISQFFNRNSTFLYGNCTQYYKTDATSTVLNGATVIGSHTQQLDLPYLLVGRLSGNPELANQGILVSPGQPLDDDFMMHRVSKNGQTIYDGRAETKIKVSGKILYRKLSESTARKLNDRYYKLKSNIFKNIFSILLNGN